MIYHFGSDVDSSAFVEDASIAAPAGAATPPPPRPAPGTTLEVRDYVTKTSLPSLVTGDYGSWVYETTDVPVIEVTGDGGTTWVPQVAAEARVSSALAPRIWNDAATVDATVRDGDLLVDAGTISTRANGAWSAIGTGSGTTGTAPGIDPADPITVTT